FSLIGAKRGLRVDHTAAARGGYGTAARGGHGEVLKENAQRAGPAISPEPRAISRVGTTWVVGSQSSPSRRRKMSDAAIRPMAEGACATTVTGGWSRSASGKSSNPTRA